MAALTAFCARTLRRAGYRVFPPQRAPEVGSLWTPTRGSAERRRVLAVTECEGGGHFVTYGHIPEGHTATVTLAAWHVWRQRARARGV